MVSVVMPVYNGSRFLRESLDSILAQTYKRLEVIVVDDGSTDDTPEILASYGPRIRVFHKPNGGGASAINLGIRQARGDWIAWLSADDLWEPTNLERQVTAIDEDPFIGLLYSDFATIDTAGKVMSHVHLPPPPTRPARVVALMRRCFINGCASLIHRDVFADVGLFDEGDRVAYDYDMWLRIVPRFEIRYLPEALAYYRVHSGQLSRRWEVMDRARRRVRSRAIRRLESGLALRSAFFLAKDLAAILPWKLKPSGGGYSLSRVAMGLADGFRAFVNPAT
jgi:glycosyltransferase involved in cell wall biosynthesis